MSATLLPGTITVRNDMGMPKGRRNFCGRTESRDSHASGPCQCMEVTLLAHNSPLVLSDYKTALLSEIAFSFYGLFDEPF